MTICVGPTLTEKDIKRLAEEMKFMPDLDELAETLCMLGSQPRLRIFYLLAELKEVCVCDMAEILDMSVPSVSQHLAKLKANGFLKSRREAQTIYYSLQDQQSHLETLKRVVAAHVKRG
jgi:DNA-binding transcriptional ArsR family regulator